LPGEGYPGGWDAQPNYGMPPGYPGGYPDYSAYYGQQAPPAPAYGAYGQPPPAAYPMPDPYAQAYAAAAAGAGAPPPAVPSTGWLWLCDYRVIVLVTISDVKGRMHKHRSR